MALALPASTQTGAQPDKGRRRGFWGRLPTKAKVGALLLGFFGLIAIIGPTLAPFDPGYSNPSPSLSINAPNATYLFGTTMSGQDVFSQVLTGIRLTMEVGLIVGVVATALSAIVGVSAAFLGGIWDEVLSLLSNVVLVIPALPLLVVLLGYKPNAGQWPTIAVLSALGWPWGARVIRAQTLAIRNRDFVAAARETGEKGWRIILLDILPNEISLIAASFVNTVLYAIAASVALAFIGIADLNSFSLGTMLYWAQSQGALSLGAWWWFVPPGLAVALMGTGLVLLNYGIDEIGNPRLRDVAMAKRALRLERQRYRKSVSGQSLPKGQRGLALRKWYPSDPTPVVRSAHPRPGASFNGANANGANGGGREPFENQPSAGATGSPR
jgi:peptide/nickel transport system permease protein